MSILSTCISSYAELNCNALACLTMLSLHKIGKRFEEFIPQFISVNMQQNSRKQIIKTIHVFGANKLGISKQNTKNYVEVEISPLIGGRVVRFNVSTFKISSSSAANKCTSFCLSSSSSLINSLFECDLKEAQVLTTVKSFSLVSTCDPMLLLSLVEIEED